MLSKNDFCAIMKDLEKQYRETEKWIDRLYELLGSVEQIYNHGYFNVAVTAIEYAMDCYNGGINDINWWIWENDFGKNSLECECNDKIYCPKTAEELYDMIVDMNESDKNE